MGGYSSVFHKGGLTPDQLLKELFELSHRPWVKHAACHNTNVDLFMSQVPDDVERAKSVCEVCPVRMECLSEAVSKLDTGTRGGMSERERASALTHLRRYRPLFRFDVARARARL